jgi:ribosomal RNA-processing protein 17
VKQANGEISGLGNDSEEDDSEDDEEEEFTGFQEPEPINQEDEYIDEDKYTTVTIESVGISRDGFSRPGDDDELAAAAAAHKADDDAVKETEEGKGKPEIRRDANGKRIWTKERPKTEWPKKKKKKFRYESKADRKVTRYKEGAKKRKQKEARSKTD